MIREAVEQAKARAQEESCEAEEKTAECENDGSDLGCGEGEAPESGETPETEDAERDGCEPESDGSNEDVKEGKGLFGRKNKKEKKDKKDEQIESLTDRLTRQMAEFDNFRKRTEKEKAAMYEIGAKSIVEQILPVVDSFERGLAAAREGMKDDEENAFLTGMDQIYRQMVKALEDAGVRPIEAVGAPFDPDFHNAVMHVEDESLGENIVAEEFQKGYMYKDSVVRHSMVKVAN